MADPDTEADLIQSIFAPLSLGAPGSYGLHDDVAFLAPAHHGLIVTQDQIIEGTHFLPSDHIDMIAKRLVRRNLSDMIAKSGIPTAAFLSLAWPEARDRAGIKTFARGLGEDLDQLCGSCPLMGGDTSVTNGPLVASLTMLGRPTTGHGQPVLRSGARIGDVVAVTGVIGDAWLGLQVRLGKLSPDNLDACVAFAMAPQPPDLRLASLVGRYASASIDVSDGLILDASHIAKASGVSINLQLDLMPLSDEARNFTSFGTGHLSDVERATMLAAGGDDYQPLMTVSLSDFDAFQDAAEIIGVRVTQIGHCARGETVSLTYKGVPVAMPATLGWQI
jgi:thiamine-monophosphate kinase